MGEAERYQGSDDEAGRGYLGPGKLARAQPGTDIHGREKELSQNHPAQSVAGDHSRGREGREGRERREG
jgi:hypothetical protein